MGIIKLSLGTTSPEVHFQKEPPIENQLYLINNYFLSPCNNKHQFTKSLHYFAKSNFFPRLISFVDESFENHWHSIYTIDKINDLKKFLKNQHYPVIDQNSIAEMKPVIVKKPWGREIWYTGIEKRGVVDISVEDSIISFTDLLNLYPKTLLGKNKTPVLIKTLDPLPQKVYGDLYLELHEKKEEVYVVTQVNRESYPDGVGKLKYGFSSQKRKELKNWNDFKKSYKKAIKDYQQIRQKIDEKWDKYKKRKNSYLSFQNWSTKLPDDLLRKEAYLREKVDSFSGHYSLKVGDVVKIDTLVPHSLQHGVRVVEFQTPVYERLILYFAQKVLTQNHWDTDKAIELMKETYPKPQLLKVIKNEVGLLIEEACTLAGSKVMRITLPKEKKMPLFSLIPPESSHCFIFALKGECELIKKTNHKKLLNSTRLTAEDCFFFPRVLGAVTIDAKVKSSFLLTYPV